jgi:hypothetical protein
MEPSIDTRDAPCPSCGHLLWFPELSKFEDQGMAVLIPGNEMTPKEKVLKFAKKRFGLPTEGVYNAISAVHASKFEKIEWDRLLEAKSWDDVLALVAVAK